MTHKTLVYVECPDCKTRLKAKLKSTTEWVTDVGQKAIDRDYIVSCPNHDLTFRIALVDYEAKLQDQSQK